MGQLYKSLHPCTGKQKCTRSKNNCNPFRFETRVKLLTEHCIIENLRRITEGR